MGLRLSALAVAAGVVLAAPAAAAADYDRWHFVRAEGTTAGTTFGEVTAPSHEIAWAAGSRGGRPLLAGWNGVRWREAPLPVPADTVLEGVAASSPRDAWVIGHTPDGTARVTRWTGARRWTAVSVPARGPSFPRAVDARSERDAWIVGSGGGARTAATSWHWDGRDWRTVPVPAPSGVNSELVAVSARAGDDAWAVGSAGGAPLVTHWDGRSWTRSATPVPASGALSDVVVLAADDVWAVGTSAPNGDVPLVLHWNGRAWRTLATPETRGRLYSVASDGRGGVWVAGEGGTGTALLAHWDGTGWSRCGAPTPAGGDAGDEPHHGAGAVWGLANAQDTPYLWAVGSYLPADTEAPVQHVLTWTNAPPSR